jgi:hypothetical protein
MTWRRRTIVAALIALVSGTVGAMDLTVVYVDGEANVRREDGSMERAFIGQAVGVGDTILTGRQARVELEERGAARITVQPDTVFSILERQERGERRSALACVLGTVRMSFLKLLGREPQIVTGSATAGVRGTELTVLSAVDGSSLIMVLKGLVSVVSQGVSVDVEGDDAVEVVPGQAPAPRFDVLRGQVSHETWQREREEDLLSDPEAAVHRLERRFEYYFEALAEIEPIYARKREALEEERKRLPEIEAEKGKSARSEYYKNTVYPLELETSYLRLNIRYFALSALSLRRYVLGRMYLVVKTNAITNLENPRYNRFLEAHDALLRRFEERISPYLVEADV